MFIEYASKLCLSDGTYVRVKWKLGSFETMTSSFPEFHKHDNLMPNFLFVNDLLLGNV